MSYEERPDVVIAKLLGLPLPDPQNQDWELCNSQPERIEEFCDLYVNTPLTDWEKHTLMQVIVSSYEEFLDDWHDFALWHKIKNLLWKDRGLHMTWIIEYWSLVKQADYEEGFNIYEDAFNITLLMRSLYREIMDSLTKTVKDWLTVELNNKPQRAIDLVTIHVDELLGYELQGYEVLRTPCRLFEILIAESIHLHSDFIPQLRFPLGYSEKLILEIPQSFLLNLPPNFDESPSLCLVKRELYGTRTDLECYIRPLHLSLFENYDAEISTYYQSQRTVDEMVNSQPFQRLICAGYNPRAVPH